MPDDDRMLDWIPQSVPWKNWHETVVEPIKGVYLLWYPEDRPPYAAAAINRCTRQIQRAIAMAKARNMPVRAVGRGWSLSSAPVVDGALLDLSRLKGMKPIRTDQIDPAYPGDADARAGLWMVQCGAFLSEINRTIESDRFGRSLRTSGAANGQTIVGATATGTHGSALAFGALHDHIVAIHLVADEQRQYWLERATRPVLKSSLPATLNAQLIRNDDLFNAVLVGLGAFGVIQNVVIETRPRFLLSARNVDKSGSGAPLVLDAAMRRVIETLDFDSHPDLRTPAGLRQPYFFQPIIDPSTDPCQVLVTLMHELDWQPGYQPDYRSAESRFGPGYDFLSVAGRLLDIFTPGIPFFAQVARGQLFDTRPRIGSWGELFGFKTLRTKVASGSVAVDLRDALRALDTLIALNRSVGPAPLVFGCRYVRQSPALLAMNQFPVTFVVSIDGVFNAAARAFMDAVPAAMEQAGIVFTQHWGKTNGYTSARVRAAFGARRDSWVSARHTLLPDPASRTLFENGYMAERGLTG